MARVKLVSKQFIICLYVDQLQRKFSENSPIFLRKSFDKYFFKDLPKKVFQSFLTSPRVVRNSTDETFCDFC